MAFTISVKLALIFVVAVPLLSLCDLRDHGSVHSAVPPGAETAGPDPAFHQRKSGGDPGYPGIWNAGKGAGGI